MKEAIDEDPEIEDIKRGLRTQLMSWARDPGMPLEEQKRMVRQLMAQWHPDKTLGVLTHFEDYTVIIYMYMI